MEDKLYFCNINILYISHTQTTIFIAKTFISLNQPNCSLIHITWKALKKTLYRYIFTVYRHYIYQKYEIQKAVTSDLGKFLVDDSKLKIVTDDMLIKGHDESGRLEDK